MNDVQKEMAKLKRYWNVVKWVILVGFLFDVVEIIRFFSQGVKKAMGLE